MWLIGANLGYIIRIGRKCPRCTHACTHDRRRPRRLFPRSRTVGIFDKTRRKRAEDGLENLEIARIGDSNLFLEVLKFKRVISARFNNDGEYNFSQLQA